MNTGPQRPGSALIIQGDARVLPLPDRSADLIVTSPPYFGQRSYEGDDFEAQIGCEESPKEYIAHLLDCTREWMRVMKPQGSVIVNMGDTYAAYNHNRGASRSFSAGADDSRLVITRPGLPPGTRSKSLMGLPWRYALACMDELGLILRAEIVWDKRNGMPERIRDRVRRTYEQVFHFTLKDRYYFAGKYGEETPETLSSVWAMPVARGLKPPAWIKIRHKAMFPASLPERCITRWSPPGGTVLDPFGGSGTTARAAADSGRFGISVDRSGEYCQLAAWRTSLQLFLLYFSHDRPDPARRCRGPEAGLPPGRRNRGVQRPDRQGVQRQQRDRLPGRRGGGHPGALPRGPLQEAGIRRPPAGRRARVPGLRLDGRLRQAGLERDLQAELPLHPAVEAVGAAMTEPPRTIYIVITKDRHADPEATPFTDRELAVAFAESEVESNARHPEFSDEWERELNDAMIDDGWVWYCQYGVEGDSVWVVERELRDQA